MSKVKKNVKKEQVKESEEKPMDMIKKLEKRVKVFNELINTRENTLYPVLEDDGDLPNYPKPIRMEPNKKILKIHEEVGELLQDVCSERNSSETKIDFKIKKKKAFDAELYDTMIHFRQQSETLFKNIISTQVSFNECLNDDLSIETKEKKNVLKKHMNLIEKTCKYERGAEPLFSLDSLFLKSNIETNLKIKTTSQFQKAYKELAEGEINRAFEFKMGRYQNHPHLIAAQKNIKSADEMLSKTLETVTIDPFTKRTIIKPVKNKFCQHVYDQDSIEPMFKQRLFISCPYIGCMNNRFTKQDLLFDHNK
ncbi:Zinc finger, MIZ-type [Cinara cedri]|uniref:E3 SUMO-protein ligase NSE2 n=1 Tax=Cinara cedri TaxID=506608 RepID=A0A5E4M208_9HEMI|nr:Zinc finger, MIZ-type [Cinara cedri]